MDILLISIRLALFGIFALAAIGKLLDLKGAEKAIKEFGTPDDLAKPFAIALPFAETVFAFCFLFPSTAWVGAIGGLILLLSFTGGMIWQMANGNAPDCHCFGQIHSEPVSRKSLVRNIIFSLLALFLISQGRDGQGMALSDANNDTMSILLIFTILILVAAALMYLKRILDNQNEILKRIELLEVVSREGVPVNRSEAGHPNDGLPIGARFPDFELENTSGAKVSLQTLLASGKPAVFLFVSPTCEPCKALLPEVEKWEAEIGDRVSFALLSSGMAEANREKFAGVFEDEVVLQENREVAESVHARWTPTAVFVRADGSVGSHLAAGDAAIRELVDKLRSSEVVRDSAAFFTTTTTNGFRPPKIGEKIPDFSLNDFEGRVVTADDIRGRRTLAVFWSPTCPHCNAMMNELREWDKERGNDDPELIVFYDGPTDPQSALGLNATVVIDPGHKTSAELGMFGTPSAVLFDEKGQFATETGVGATNIWALIGRRK